MQSFPYEVSVYETEDGEAPFSDWLKSLRDRNSQTVLETL